MQPFHGRAAPKGCLIADAERSFLDGQLARLAFGAASLGDLNGVNHLRLGGLVGVVVGSGGQMWKQDY